MAKEYTYLLKQEFERAERAVLEINKAFVASAVSLTNDELDVMSRGVERALLPYLREKLVRQACIDEGLSAADYEASSYDTKKFIKAKSEMLGHKYDAFCEEWGVRNLDGGPIRIVSTGNEAIPRYARHPNAEAWLSGHNKIPLTDFFTTAGDGTIQLRGDWLKNLEARYTAVIPPEMRPAWNTLQRIKKELHELESMMNPWRVTLSKLCEAADDQDSLVNGIWWK